MAGQAPSGGSGSGSDHEDDPFAVRPATDADRERPLQPLAPIGWGRSADREPVPAGREHTGPEGAEPTDESAAADEPTIDEEPASGDVPALDATDPDDLRDAGVDPAPADPPRAAEGDILAGIVPLDPVAQEDRIAPLDQVDGTADADEPGAPAEAPVPEPEIADAPIDADLGFPAEHDAGHAPAPAPAYDEPGEVLTGEVLTGEVEAEPDAADDAPAELVLQPLDGEPRDATAIAEDDEPVVDAELVEDPAADDAAEDAPDDAVELIPLRDAEDEDAEVVDDPADAVDERQPAATVPAANGAPTADAPDADADADRDVPDDEDGVAEEDDAADLEEEDDAPAPRTPAAAAARAAALAWASGAAPLAPAPAAASAARATAPADAVPDATDATAGAPAAPARPEPASEPEVPTAVAAEPVPAYEPEPEPDPAPPADAAVAQDSATEAPERATAVPAHAVDDDVVASGTPSPVAAHAPAIEPDDDDDEPVDALALLFGDAAGEPDRDRDAASDAPAADAPHAADDDRTRALPSAAAGAAGVGAVAAAAAAPHADRATPAGADPDAASRPEASARPAPVPPPYAAPPAPRPPAPAAPAAASPRPPASPAAPPRDPRGPRRTALWVGGAILLVLLLVGLFYLGQRLGSADPDAAPVATETAEATPTPTPTPADPVQGPAAAGVQAWDALLGGECIEPYATPWEEEFTVVDCGVEHHAQMVARVALPQTEDEFPGEDAVRDSADELCIADTVIDYAAARAYDDVQYQSAYPLSQDEWAAGDRNAYCFVSRAGGGTFTGPIGVPQPPVVP